MKNDPLFIEPLESRKLLSASVQTDAIAEPLQVQAVHDSVKADALTYYNDANGDPEERGYESEVTISWTRAATTPIRGFDILFSYDGGQTYNSTGTAKKSPFIANEFGTGINYVFKVCPYTKDGGDQAPLGTASVITPLEPPTIDSLDAQTDSSVEVTCDAGEQLSSSFDVSWSPVGDPSNIHSKFVAGVVTPEGGDDFNADGDTVITGLSPGTKYDISVTQNNGLTTSPPATQTILALATPTNVKAKTYPDQTVRVSWSSVSTATTGYKVEWAPTPHQSPKPASGSMIVGKNTRSVVIAGLTEAFNYVFRVVAIDGKSKAQPAGGAQKIIPSVLDRSFSPSIFGDGYSPMLTPIGNGNATASGIAFSDVDDIAVVGTADHNFQIVEYDLDEFGGNLNTSFGHRGVATVDFGGDDSARAVAVRANGDILVVGTSGNSFAMADLKQDGSLNHSFGHNGRIGYFNGDPLDAWNVALAADGQEFFIAGIAANGSGRSAIVQEFQADGQPDPSWDSAAARIPNVTGKQTAMAIQSTQKIILASQMNNGIVVSRFNRDGSVDAGFGDDGEQIVHFGSSAQNITSMAIDPRNDDILLAGSEGSGAKSAFAIARLTANGKLDTTFNGTGEVQAFVKNAHASAQAVTVLSTGQVVAVGAANGNFAVAEYTPGGQQDKNFDVDGLITTDEGSPNEIASALFNDGDFSIYVAGTSGADFSVAHYFVDAG